MTEMIELLESFSAEDAIMMVVVAIALFHVAVRLRLRRYVKDGKVFAKQVTKSVINDHTSWTAVDDGERPAPDGNTDADADAGGDETVENDGGAGGREIDPVSSWPPDGIADHDRESDE